jgi:hypothetical protein
MIGIAFGYPEPIGGMYFTPKDELQFARIEVGPVVPLSAGKGNVGPYYWRKWELPLEEKNTMAEKILAEVGHRPREISGFTLFWQSSVYTKADGQKTDGPGFQMSIRRKGEDGWDVRIISEEEAMRVFNLLRNIGHPDGPWELTEQMRVDARDNFIVPQSAVEGWPKKEPPQEVEYFESKLERTETWPYAKVREALDLKALLARCEGLVDALSDQVATLVAGEP